MITRLRSFYLEFAAATLLTATTLGLTLHPLAADEASNRIVAVGGSVTEVVFALEEERRLVARDSTSVHPQEAYDLPDIGYIRALSPEGVLSVDPDLLLMLDGSGPQEAVDVLQKSGIAIANVPNEFTPEGIVAKIRAVGEALGVPDKANALAQKTEADLKTAQEHAAGQNENVRVLFILSTRGGRIMAGGADTAANGIITLAGAKNAVSEFSGYKQLSDEAILSAMPDVVLMMDREGDHSASADDLFSHPALSQTPAGKANRLLKMPGDYLLGFGPRTADAIQDLAQNLSEIRS